MDLAESIRANTAAVQALNGTIERIFGARILRDVPAGPLATPAEWQAAGRPVVDLATFVAESATPAETEKSPSGHTEVTLADVKAAAIALAKQNRDALAMALVKFGAPKVVDLKPSDYAAFLATIAEHAAA